MFKSFNFTRFPKLNTNNIFVFVLYIYELPTIFSDSIRYKFTGNDKFYLNRIHVYTILKVKSSCIYRIHICTCMLEQVVKFYGGNKECRRVEVNSVSQQVCRDLRNKKKSPTNQNLKHTIILPQSKIPISLNPNFVVRDNKLVLTLEISDLTAPPAENDELNNATVVDIGVMKYNDVIVLKIQ